MSLFEIIKSPLDIISGLQQNEEHDSRPIPKLLRSFFQGYTNSELG